MKLLLIASILLLAGVQGIPMGMTTWFRSDSCPNGWSELESSKGRLIVSVSNASFSGLTVETPLANGEDRVHTHQIASKVFLDVKSVSAIGCCNPDGACYGDYPLNGATTATSSDLPFVQLLLCSYTGVTTAAPVPYGTISFFDNTVAKYSQCSDIPGVWKNLESVVGRSILPGYTTGLFTSISSPLESQEDRKHQHVFTSTIVPVDQDYAGVTGCCDKKLAEDKHYTVTDATEPVSSHIPYIQLLTCVSQNQTFDSALPSDAYIFTEISCPAGYRLTSLLSGRYLVSLPQNGVTGDNYGGPSLPQQTVVGNTHTHPFNTHLRTNPCEIGLASGCCGSGYMHNQEYDQSGITEKGDVEFPFISVPICEKA